MNRERGLILAIIVLAIASLEVVVRAGYLQAQIVPSPSSVMFRLIDVLASGEIIRQIGQSLKSLLMALTLTVIIVLPMSVLSRKYSFFRNFFSFLASVFNPIPSVAVLPLFLLWFGIGQSTVVATLLHSTVWSFYSEALNGLEMIPKMYQTVAQSVALSGYKRFYHLTLPASLATFLTALKTAWARAWRALIGVEMIFGTISGAGGLGWFIFESRVFADATSMVVGLVFIALFGYLFEYVLFELIERHTVRKWGMK